VVTLHRVRLTREERDWAKAERLQRLLVDWSRQRAEPALAAAPERRDASQLQAIRTLGVSLQHLADIQKQQGRATCAAIFREALDLAGAIGDGAMQATCAFNLGHAYNDIAGLRNLDEAERWYRQSFDLRAPHDGLGRGRCVSQLAALANYRTFGERAADRIQSTERLIAAIDQALAQKPA
jgi:hypothetical protein